MVRMRRNSFILFLFAFFLFMILPNSTCFMRVYHLDELLKRYRIMMKYRKLISEEKIVTGFDVDSSLGLIPLENIGGSIGVKVEFLDSLDVFLDVENLEKMKFGVSWNVMKHGSAYDDKEFMRRIIEGEIEIVNIYFNYLETKEKVIKLKESLEKSDVTWKTTAPVDYGLLRIELQNMKDRLKTMCGLSAKEELEIVVPEENIFELSIDLNKVLDAVYVLYSPPNLDMDLDLKAFLSRESEDMRLNVGFDLSWSENLDFERSNWRYFAGLEMDKVKKLYSQMEFLKKVLKDYKSKDENTEAIFRHYSLEIMRLYNQLKIMEEMVK